MSRIEEGDGPDDTESFLRMCAFDGNVRRAVAGKKGRAFFAELEAALVALPEKRLAKGALTRSPRTIEVNGFEVLRFMPEDQLPRGEYCALGAVLVKRDLDKGVSKIESLRRHDDTDGEDDEDLSPSFEKIEEAAAGVGICTPLAYAVIEQNDFWSPDHETPEQRYARILAWVRKKLAAPEKAKAKS